MEVIARAGRIDVQVNNAGQMQEIGIADMTLAMWQDNLMVNLTAPLLMIPGWSTTIRSICSGPDTRTRISSSDILGIRKRQRSTDVS